MERLNYAAPQKAIAYDPGVMESIRRAAQTAFDLEAPIVMGLLVGHRLATGISVSNWILAADSDLARAIELAHRLHPADQILGWFRSKHQGEARLTTTELEEAHHLFGQVPPLVLVFRPSGQRPMRVGGYLPAADGHWAGERPMQEFFLQSPEIALPTSTSRAASGPRVQPIWSPRRLWALSALLLTTVLGLTMLGQRPTAPAMSAPVKLWVQSAGSQRTLRWTANPEAQQATLTIGQQAIPLLPSQFRLAAYVLPAEKPGEDLDLLLRVEGAQPSESRLRLVAAPAPPPAPPEVVAKRHRRRPR